MLSPQYFIEQLKEQNMDFFTGIPDSLLKSLCAYILAELLPENNIIAANEGAAVGIAAGYYLATGNIPVVYMQNSGLGNTVNPLLSLMDKDVFNIPTLLLIGWRGEPNVNDEPQHIKQGKVTIPLLDVIGVKNVVLSKDETVFKEQLNTARTYLQEKKEAYAFVIQSGTFSDFQTENNIKQEFDLSREIAIQRVVDSMDRGSVVVSTTGMISRELFEYREQKKQPHKSDFLTVGSMGHASQIALGIALNKKKQKVYCFDGDGAALMHLGSMAVIGDMKPQNFVHVLFNNGAHDSVGGQPTVGLRVDIPAIALACGYSNVFSIEKEVDLKKILDKLNADLDGPVFIEIKVGKGARKDIGRPTITPIENKEAFMMFLSELK